MCIFVHCVQVENTSFRDNMDCTFSYPMKQCDHSSKNYSKCLLSAVTHGRRRACHWVTAAQVTCGQIWNLDRFSTNHSKRWSTHGFACGRCASAPCRRLHSPPAWDQGCLEPLEKWYEIRISRLSISMVLSRSRARWAVNADAWVNFMERTLMETVNFWRPFIKVR